jgi:hypothetical protein
VSISGIVVRRSHRETVKCVSDGSEVLEIRGSKSEVLEVLEEEELI